MLRYRNDKVGGQIVPAVLVSAKQFARQTSQQQFIPRILASQAGSSNLLAVEPQPENRREREPLVSTQLAIARNMVRRDRPATGGTCFGRLIGEQLLPTGAAKLRYRNFGRTIRRRELGNRRRVVAVWSLTLRAGGGKDE